MNCVVERETLKLLSDLWNSVVLYSVERSSWAIEWNNALWYFALLSTGDHYIAMFYFWKLKIINSNDMRVELTTLETTDWNFKWLMSCTMTATRIRYLLLVILLWIVWQWQANNGIVLDGVFRQFKNRLHEKCSHLLINYFQSGEEWENCWISENSANSITFQHSTCSRERKFR